MPEPALEAMRTIAHPLRYAILKALVERRLNVGEIEQKTGIGQPTLSQQLAVLRNAGLVDSVREAKLVYYSLKPGPLRDAVESVRALVPEAAPGRDGEGKDRSLIGAAAFARLG